MNEAAVKQFGWEEPLGKRFEVVFLERQGTVIGVVEDYHHESLERPIGPTAIYMRSPFYSYLSLRVRSENFSETVDHLEETWNRFVPNRLFRFWFVDEQIDSLYREDRRLAQLFTVFASLAIFVACLGLFGLTAYTVEQRTKEIGVRKILGATVTDVVGTVSRSFLGMVVLACAVALPLSFLLMRRWLKNFAYRTELEIRVTDFVHPEYPNSLQISL